jgi:hypothetical protein
VTRSSSNLSRRRRVHRLGGCALPRPDRSDRPGDSGRGEQHDRGPRSPRRNIDAEALALRENGRSYSAIARTLDLKRATDAREAFLRGLRATPEDERKLIVDREHRRLDQLEARIKARDTDAPDKLERRMAALAALRRDLN